MPSDRQPLGSAADSPSIALVVAMDQQGAIGRAGALPWHLPDDLKRFKQITLGHPILMGRATFSAIGRALPQRRNLVLSRDPGWSAAGVESVASLQEALKLVAGSDCLMVIGGAQVYAQTLAAASRLYLCEVHARVADADTWFPDWDRSQWIELQREAHPVDERHSYAFDQVILQRR